MRTLQIESLVLGCTHYPMLHDAIAEFLGEQVQIIECSRAIAQDVTTLLKESKSENLATAKTGELRCFVTDEPARFTRFGEISLRQNLTNVEKCFL